MVSKINHKGKEILYVDYTDCKSVDEMVENLKKAQQIVIKDNKPYLQLTNVTNAYVTAEFMTEAKKVAKETPKIAIKRAIVGIDSVGRKVLLRGYNLLIGKNALRPFDNLVAAKDWLVK